MFLPEPLEDKWIRRERERENSIGTNILLFLLYSLQIVLVELRDILSWQFRE